MIQNLEVESLQRMTQRLVRDPSESHRRRPQPLVLAGVGPIQNIGKATGPVVLAILVEDHRQVEPQQGVASARAAAAQTAVQLRAHLCPPAARKQCIEAGDEAVAIEPRHHRLPPVGQHRGDPQTPVEDTVIRGQIGYQIERLVGFEPPDGAGPERQDLAQRGRDLWIDVPDVTASLQIVDRHDQGSHLHARRQRPQVGRRRTGDVRSSLPDHVEQQALDPQARLQPAALQVRGALQVLLREREASSPATLIGGLEKPDGLQVENPLVVRGTPPRLCQRRLRAPVRIPGVVQRRHLQPRIGVLGVAFRQLRQDVAHPAAGPHGVAPQHIEQKSKCRGRLRIGGKACRHQVDHHHCRVLGAFAQQCRERLYRLGIEEMRADPRTDAGAGERLQHAGARNRLIGPAGERDRQHVKIVLGTDGIPRVAGCHFLRQHAGLRLEARQTVAGKDAAGHSTECGYGQRAVERRSGDDHQQLDPRPDGILRVDGLGKAVQMPFDLTLDAGVERLPKLGGRCRNRRSAGAERPPHRVRSRRPGAGGATPELGNRAAQRKVFRHQIDGTLQTVLVAGGEACHRLAEQPPWSKRRAARHAGKETRGALPVPGVHGVDATPYRRRVLPERVIHGEMLDSLPAAVDHQTVSQRPLGRWQRRPAGEVLGVYLQGFTAFQAAQKADQILLRQRFDGDRGAVLRGSGAHRCRLFRKALAVQLSRAFDTGAEQPQR